jgi:glucokinase
VSLPVLAIDVGGTKLAAGLVTADGAVTVAQRIPTPTGRGPEIIWNALTELADAVLAEAGSPALQGIGVGCGGPMEWPAGRVTPLNMPDWQDFPLRERLQKRHPGLTVRLHNDAPCFTAAEHWVGAGRGSEFMMGMVVSTGVGGGLILGGRLVDGGTGNAGHIGHVVVDPVGPVCNCGGIGCLQAVARGPAVVEWARQHGWVAGADAAGPELAASARAGDPVAASALALAGTAVGVAISSVAALLDLDLVVVGGGLAESGEVLFGPLRRAVERHLCVPYGKRLEVLPSGVGQHAGLVGAAALVHRGDAYWSAG